MEDVREGTPARGRRRGDRVVRVNDIVTDPSVAALKRQGIVGDDACEARAFAAYLRLFADAPENGHGRSILPEPWVAYAAGGPRPPDELVAEALGEPVASAA